MCTVVHECEAAAEASALLYACKHDDIALAVPFGYASIVQRAGALEQSILQGRSALCVPESAVAKAVFLQIIFMTGWAPHASQQRPMQRGSAEVTLESLQAELEKRKASKPGP